MAADPIAKFRRWMKDAAEAGVELPDAAALATADKTGKPAVRYVLVKAAGDDGFVFYTNAESAKGRDLAANPRAALAWYWHPTGKQVRVEGRIEPVSAKQADAYWLERPVASRIASVASRQSRPLASRADLVREYRRVERESRRGEVARPARWTGYRLVPASVEFWIRKEPRLHRRELFSKSGGGGWKRTLLQP